MAWVDDIELKLRGYFDAENTSEFKELILLHPEHLRNDDGSDHWMWLAAVHNNLPMIKALVELGLNVNESHDPGDDSDPYYEPEGPVLQASVAGHIEIVEWLLSNGAKINYTVNNVSRCLPLIRAAAEGHFEICKLLVQHGADVHATWHGLNAAKQAERFGKFEIRDYLLAQPKLKA